MQASSQNCLRGRPRAVKEGNVWSKTAYGFECWKLTAKLAHKLETFKNRCLRKILGVFWPNTITNDELLRNTDATSLATQIKKRRWRWLGHVCRMSPGALPKTALRWTADGKTRRGRPKETWRRTVEKEMKECGLTWNTITKWAADQQQWRSLVDAYVPPGTETTK